MIQKWFEMGFFRLLRCLRWNPNASILAIARLEDLDWDDTGAEMVPFNNEQLWLFFSSAVSEVTQKWLDWTEINDCSHYELCSIYGKEFADSGMSRLYAEHAWHLFLENGDDYTMYQMLEEQDRVTGCLESLVMA